VRIAIIGAGPAGFYAAEALLKQDDYVCAIDIFDRFPTPYGLVRTGVAPDHQSIKAVTRIYERIASNPRVRYFGNVTYGKDITHQDVRQFFDQVVYAVGAQSDRHMGIPGEELYNSMPATAFVGWYNGHPDYRELDIDLTCERAVVVGNGNVAMDVARMLAMSPDELAKTDMADFAIERLRESKIREVIMLGRRGPAQAAFTTPELKEFGELEGTDVIVHPEDLDLDEHSAALLDKDKKARGNIELLREYLTREPQAGNRRIDMRFLTSPKEIIGQDGKVTAVRVERNELILREDGRQVPRGTGQFETLEVGLVLRSVGYQGMPLLGVPFDEKSHTIPNISGRVAETDYSEIMPGEYVVGWAKRGPSGVIGTNKPDSVATVKSMLEDIPELEGIVESCRPPERIDTLLQERRISYVTFDEWKVLDKHEVDQGTQQGRPRVKVTTVPEMLQVVKQ
jgi:ferredoxin--NADP+ reductase